MTTMLFQTTLFFLYTCTFLQVDNAGKTHACGGEGEWIGDRWVCSAGHTCLPFVL